MSALLYILNAGLYAFLIYEGFQAIEYDQVLYDEFMRVGWENYAGPDLDTPDNTYYLTHCFASIGTGLLIFLNNKFTGKTAKLAPYLLGFSGFFLLSYILLYCSDGSISLKESMYGWIFSSSFQILLSVGICYEGILEQSTKQYIKQLYGFNAWTYVALLALGFYYLSWDNQILEDIQRIANYQGPDKDDPENQYHLILIIAAVLSLLLPVFDKELSVKGLRYYRDNFIVLFVYAVFVYINDGNPNMQETKWYWVVLCLSSILFSAYRFQQTSSQLEDEQESTPNILDDLRGF